MLKIALEREFSINVKYILPTQILRGINLCKFKSTIWRLLKDPNFNFGKYQH